MKKVLFLIIVVITYVCMTACGISEESGHLLSDSETDSVSVSTSLESSEAESKNIIASGKCGEDMLWELDEEGIIVIRGTGSMWSMEEYPWDKKKIKAVIVEEGVTEIGSGAFRDCEFLDSLSIADSATGIGSNVFSGTPWFAAQGEFVILNDILLGYQGTESDVVIPDNVTAIGACAFMESDLTSVNIPEGVTSINGSAFYNCYWLERVNIPDSLVNINYRAFGNCYRLEEIYIPEGVLNIEGEAFANCFGLIRVNIPSSVINIKEKAFYDCASLSEVTVLSNDVYIGAEAFEGTPWLRNQGDIVIVGGNLLIYQTSDENVTIPDGVTRIGDYVFFRNNCLKSVNIPERVTSIGNYAFSGCDQLTSVAMPDSIADIGKCAFAGCLSLKLSIPQNVISIGDEAFCFCQMGDVTIPKGVTHIGEKAFYRSKITSISVEEGNPDYASENGVLFDGSRTKLIYYPFQKSDGSYVIPEGVTSIRSYAFSGCSSLQSISIPEGVTSIGEQAFSDCSSLQSISIPEGVTNIGKSTFRGCSSLVNISLPNSVTNIGEAAFSWCGGLVNINIPDGVTSIEREAFRFCNSLQNISIPASVTSIGSSAFDVGYSDFCLKDIYYGGSEEEWQKLGGDKYMGIPSSVTIHYESAN